MIALLVLLATLLLLLAIPVELEFAGRWPAREPASVAVRWCYGLINVNAPVDLSPKSADGIAPRRPRRTRSGAGRFSAARLLSQRRFRERLCRFVSAVWRAIDKRDIRVKLRLGTGDPAETGRLWAFLGPLSGYLHSLRSCEITLVPDFDHAVAEAEGRGSLSFAPARLLASVIAFACSPVVWRSVARARS